MSLKTLSFSLLVFALCGRSMGASAQVIITGHVVHSKSGQSLSSATVLDTTTDLATYTDTNGYYKIEVHPGDVLLYKYVGFYTMTYKIPRRLEYIIHDVVMVPKRQKLKTVEVQALTPYQRDSLARIKTFGSYLKRPETSFIDPNSNSRYDQGYEDDGTNSHQLKGFGITLHPFTYFSKKNRRKRKFHRRYKKFEQKAFIDTRYQPQLVQRLTGLKKDSLRTFMLHHRPPYHFTRYASNLEFWSWIIRNCRVWRDSLKTAAKSK